jgi:hypothetical protein
MDFSLFTSFQPALWQFNDESIESAFCNNYCCIKLVLDFDRIEKGRTKNAEIYGMVRYGINDNTSVALY